VASTPAKDSTSTTITIITIIITTEIERTAATIQINLLIKIHQITIANALQITITNAITTLILIKPITETTITVKTIIKLIHRHRRLRLRCRPPFTTPICQISPTLSSATISNQI